MKIILLLLLIICSTNISAQTSNKEIEKFIKKNLSSITNRHNVHDNLKIIACSDEEYYLLCVTGLHERQPSGQIYFNITSDNDIKKNIFKGALFHKDNIDIIEDFYRFDQKEKRKVDPIQKPVRYDSGDWSSFQYGFNFTKISYNCKCCAKMYEIYYAKINIE